MSITSTSSLVTLAARQRRLRTTSLYYLWVSASLTLVFAVGLGAWTLGSWTSPSPVPLAVLIFIGVSVTIVSFCVHQRATSRYFELRSMITSEASAEFETLLELELNHYYKAQKIEQLPDDRHQVISDQVAEHFVYSLIMRAAIIAQTNAKIAAAR